jgi:hypothetical protein
MSGSFVRLVSRNLRIAGGMGSYHVRAKPLFSLSKKLYTRSLALVGSWNGFKGVSISL